MTIWDQYLAETPQRVKLVDAFLGFLVIVGGLQFVYCLLVGNYVSVPRFYLVVGSGGLSFSVRCFVFVVKH